LLSSVAIQLDRVWHQRIFTLGDHMSKKLGLAAVFALVLIISSSTYANADSPQQASAEHGNTQRLVFLGRPLQQDYIDVGAQGPSLGDYQVFSHELFKDGRKVGTDGGTCTVTYIPAGGGNTSQCLVTSWLPKGQITTLGLVTFPAQGSPAPFMVAITGGTGAYRTARGVLTVTMEPNIVAFDLILNSQD